MLQKLVSKFAKSEPSTSLTSAELDAKASIDTIDKCYQLLEKLEVSLKLNIDNDERKRLLRKQIDEVKLAIIHHQVNDERARVEAVFKRDTVACDAAKSKAQESHRVATAKLQEARTKYQGIVDRLTPLQDELARNRVAAEEVAKTAQASFDAAIASGDASAETIASERLYQSLKASDAGGMSGPLALRIAALQRELDAFEQVVADANNLVALAEKAIADADADLALLNYDQQVQKLLAAWVIQKVATKCKVMHNQGGRTFISTAGAFEVDLFELQISSIERTLFGLNMDVYNRRHLPNWICEHLVKVILEGPWCRRYIAAMRCRRG